MKVMLRVDRLLGALVCAWCALAAASAADYQEVRVGARTGRIQAPEPFLAAGANWKAAAGSPTLFQHPRIMVRTSGDGLRWTRWTRMNGESSGGCAPDLPSTRAVTGLAFFEPGSRWLEYQLAPEIDIDDFRFAFIDPGRTPQRTLDRFRARSLPQASGEPAPAQSQPKFVSRVDWGSPDGANARGPVSYAPVTHLIVHHSADNFTGVDYAAWMRAIWTYHVFNNGWVDFGYNWAIAPDGVLYEGRAGGDNVIGAHFSCQNTGTMGVVLLGTFSQQQQQPTPEARATLARLLAWKAAQRSIDPLGRSTHAGMNSVIDNISGHRDGNRLPGSCTVTECPGDAFYPKLADVRRDVADLLAAPATPTVPPPPPLSEDFDKQPGALPENWKASGMWRWWDGMAWFGMPETKTYEPGGTGTLESPEFELTAAAVLRFRSWQDTETGRAFYDRKFVELSVDGGDWMQVAELTGGPDREWTERSYPLAAQGAGRKVRIRFRFDSVDDVANAFEGWYLDDILVTYDQLR